MPLRLVVFENRCNESYAVLNGAIKILSMNFHLACVVPEYSDDVE
jgi:hypothetical protein